MKIYRVITETFIEANDEHEAELKIKEILKLNIKQWDETQHDPVDEFKILVEMIEEK